MLHCHNKVSACFGRGSGNKVAVVPCDGTGGEGGVGQCAYLRGGRGAGRWVGGWVEGGELVNVHACGGEGGRQVQVDGSPT